MAGLQFGAPARPPSLFDSVAAARQQAAPIWSQAVQQPIDAAKAWYDWRMSQPSPTPMDAAMGFMPMGGIGSIRAFHGSPHSFDAFDLGKIGTGEGAQAYGHGLYFAGNEATAKSYRDTLAQTRWAGSADYHGALNARANIQKEMDSLHDLMVRQSVKMGAVDHPEWGDLGVTPLPEVVARHQKYWDNLVRQANAVEETIKRETLASAANKGHMYEVNIAADPHQLLDWDKPLSEQSPYVQQSLRPEALGLKPAGPFGEKGYHGWIDENGKLIGMARTGSLPETAFNPKEIGPFIYRGSGSWSDPAAASARFNKAGIPGIQYLDQGSRMSQNVADLHGTLGVLRNAAKKYPEDAVIGQRIKDLQGELDAAEAKQTRNYVIFDPKIITILRKYGIGGLTTGTAGAGLAFGQQGQQ